MPYFQVHKNLLMNCIESSLNFVQQNLKSSKTNSPKKKGDLYEIIKNLNYPLCASKNHTLETNKTA